MAAYSERTAVQVEGPSPYALSPPPPPPKAAEADLLKRDQAGELRSVILRPSFIWTTRVPAALPAVAAFCLLHSLRVPYVQRPVRLEALAAAAAEGLRDSGVRGVRGYREIDALAARHSKK